MNPVRTGLKAALASAAAVTLLSTGMAFAAGGHAPWSHTPSATAADDTSQDTSEDAAPSTKPTHPAHPTESESSDVASESAGAGPDVHAFWGLCHAYAAGHKADHGQALESPAFLALALAAGGPDQVAAYCATIPAPGGAETADASRPALPSQATSRPTQAASSSHPVPPSHPASPSHPVPPSHPTPSHPTAPPTHPTAPSHP